MDLWGWEIFSSDSIFWNSVPVSIKWVVGEVVMQLIFGMILALLLNQSFKGRELVLALTLIPWAVSGVLTTMLWLLIFNQHIGLLNDLLMKLGIIKERIAWLANPNTVFGSVMLAEFWRGIPFFAITLLAALQTIPQEVYESCAIDGCGAWKKFWCVTLLPVYMMQTSIIQGDYGYGSALAVIIFAILTIFAVVYLGMSNFGRGMDE